MEPPVYFDFIHISQPHSSPTSSVKIFLATSAHIGFCFLCPLYSSLLPQRDLPFSLLLPAFDLYEKTVLKMVLVTWNSFRHHGKPITFLRTSGFHSARETPASSVVKSNVVLDQKFSTMYHKRYGRYQSGRFLGSNSSENETGFMFNTLNFCMVLCWEGPMEEKMSKMSRLF